MAHCDPVSHLDYGYAEAIAELVAGGGVRGPVHLAEQAGRKKGGSTSQVELQETARIRDTGVEAACGHHGDPERRVGRTLG